MQRVINICGVVVNIVNILSSKVKSSLLLLYPIIFFHYFLLSLNLNVGRHTLHLKIQSISLNIFVNVEILYILHYRISPRKKPETILFILQLVRIFVKVIKMY